MMQSVSPVVINRLDHLVLTVADIETTCEFYARVLGMQVVRFGEERTALRFGAQKINLHQHRRELEPKSLHPTPGSGDLCFITDTPLESVMAHLERCGVALIEPPSPRTGAIGTITSIYFRDPDGNLIEVSQYD